MAKNQFSNHASQERWAMMLQTPEATEAFEIAYGMRPMPPADSKNDIIVERALRDSFMDGWIAALEFLKRLAATSTRANTFVPEVIEDYDPDWVEKSSKQFA